MDAPATHSPPPADAPLAAELTRRARGIRLLVLDVDGVLTDGRLYYSSAGEESKAFHIQDGLGVKLLQGSGVRVAVISGRCSAGVERRARELGIERLFQGVEDKRIALETLLREGGLNPQQVACMGDDLPDLPLIRRCALGITVPEAPALLRQHAHYVTRRSGGAGAVREACELIMRAQDTLGAALQRYLS